MKFLCHRNENLGYIIKILIIDVASNGLDLALRCQGWGHEVQWFDDPGKGGLVRLTGDGMFKKIRDLTELRRKWIGWADLIVLMDNAKYIQVLDPFFKLGYPIYGCNAESSRLELDRDFGQDVLKTSGIEIIDSTRFFDYNRAIKYVEKNSDRVFVSKPCGDADRALSYVSSSAADMIYMMERWLKRPDLVKQMRQGGFIVQERKYGCEMAAGGWFHRDGWSKFWCENFEYKKMLPGDLGVTTGEQGTLARVVTESLLADKVLKPITDKLIELDYVGYVDVNCIVDEDGTPWPMEFTMRCGCPMRYNMASVRQGDPAQWMLDMVNGLDSQEFSEDVCISVVVSIPDYPYSKITKKEVQGIPVYFSSGISINDVHMVEMMMSEKPIPIQIGDKVMRYSSYVTAGDFVMVVTGTGKTITGARRSAYATIDKIKIPNSPQYRIDIGRGKLVHQLESLTKLGYASGLSY